MKIFIPRVPKTTTKNELEGLVGSLLDKRFHFPFTKRPKVDNCDVLQFRDDEGIVEYHGLVSVTPDDAGSWLISHFKNQHLHDKLVFAREFMPRRRQKGRFSKESERRRQNVQITKVVNSNPQVMAIDTFRREHGSS